MFNGTIPKEFVDFNDPNYIQTNSELWPWKVMLKSKWNDFKSEVKDIKKSLVELNLNNMHYLRKFKSNDQKTVKE